VARLYIDGRWCDAESGATYPIPNPATEAIVGHAADAARPDMDRAIHAARRAFDEGPWRKTTVEDRARIVLKLAALLEKRREELRELLVSAFAAEAMTHSIQIDAPIEHLRTYAELAKKLDFDEALPIGTHTSRAGAKVVSSIAHRQPAGVCGLIPTWNYPLYVTAQKIGPALLAGCTMVVKPSPFGPLVDTLVAELLEECDLPPGVYNVVTGQSPELGQALSESPAVDKVSFTGSTTTGKAIARAASGTLKRLHLELGGKSAAIVLEDADLDAAAPGLAAPAYFHAGQGCALCTRVLVPKKLHDAVVDRMLGFVKSFVKVGDPTDPRVTLGPLIREERRRAVEDLIASGVEQGATLVTGGKRPSAPAKGWFLEPTIFTNVENAMHIAQKEIFGPVVCVLRYEDEADAIRIANASSYGLSGAILTKDVPKAIEMAKRLRTGGVSINQANHAKVTPFGGFKESGLGREGGLFGLLEYTEIQRISWPA
jgi:acyl-CoA reductase-like NAD-dependent aldehyde dehydrogenase